jgi:hypothetical protein
LINIHNKYVIAILNGDRGSFKKRTAPAHPKSGRSERMIHNPTSLTLLDCKHSTSIRTIDFSSQKLSQHRGSHPFSPAMIK